MLQDGVWTEGGLVVMYPLGFFACMVGIYNKCGEKPLLDVTAQKLCSPNVPQVRQQCSSHLLGEGLCEVVPNSSPGRCDSPWVFIPLFQAGAVPTARELQRAGLSV